MASPGTEVRDFIDAHCRRGGKALVLEPSDRGDMIVVRHGRREMQLAWTHLLPATFGGRARMNVQNSLAAAAAAFAAGAPLHDIRQGLRTFSTNYYLSPGRLNEIEVERRPRHRRLLPQRARHADARRLRRPGRRRASTQASDLGRAVADRRRSPPPATAATRTCVELGAIAADHFDVIVVREDAAAARPRARARRPRWWREGVRQRSMREGARCKQVEVVLDEIEAIRHAMSRANPGDLVVLCVDKHPAVLAELESWSNAGPGRLPALPTTS